MYNYSPLHDFRHFGLGKHFNITHAILQALVISNTLTLHSQEFSRHNPHSTNSSLDPTLRSPTNILSPISHRPTIINIPLSTTPSASTFHSNGYRQTPHQEPIQTRPRQPLHPTTTAKPPNRTIGNSFADHCTPSKTPLSRWGKKSKKTRTRAQVAPRACCMPAARSALH